MQDWSESPPPPSTPQDPHRPTNPYAPPSNPYAPPSAMGGPPGDGVGSVEELPWIHRSQIGWWTAMVETIKLVFTNAAEAYGRVRANGDYVSPFLYGLLISWVMSIIGQLWALAFTSLFGAAMMGSEAGIEGMLGMGGASLLQVILVVIFWPIVYPFFILLSAALNHLAILIVGGLSNSPSRFEGTFNIVSYAQTAMIATIVPVLGNLVAAVMQFYFNYQGFLKVHRTTPTKALLATLMPVILCCGCILLVIAMMGTGEFFEALSQ